MVWGEVVGGELQEGEMVVTGQNVSSAARTQSNTQAAQVLVVVHRVWVAPVEEEGNQLLGAATSPRWWAAFDAAN